MIQTIPPGARGRRVSSLRLVALLLPLALGLGCAGNDKGDDTVATPTAPVSSTATATVRPDAATPTPTVAPADIALAACQKLAACNQCFLTERGTCLDPAQCAARLSEDEARCINAVAGCSPDGLGDCLTVGCGGDGSGECE